LKKIEHEEIGPDEFTVKVILDGKKLDAYGYGRGDNMDRVRLWKRVKVNRSGHQVTTQDYVNESEMGCWADEATSDSIYCTVTMHILSGPTRMEFLTDVKGENQASAGMRDALYNWTDPMVRGVQDVKMAKVRISADAPSIKERGSTSHVSEPMDSHVDYDAFFGSLIKLIREGMAAAPGSSLTDTSETEFFGEVSYGEEGSEKSTRTTVKYSQESGDVEMVVTQDGHIARTTFYKLHQSPLVLEGWDLDSDGKRSSSNITHRQMQRLTNEGIERANSWFG